jgi:putative ABC transport system permease protein
MPNLLRDLGYAMRMLAKYPGFTAIAVLTLALGIGANTAIFSFVNAALLKPLPYASPEKLFVLGEPRQQALAEMRTINAALAAAHPVANASNQITMRSLGESITGRIRPLLLILFGAVGFVLMIACANVAHLSLAKAATRKKEIAIRVALGATRYHIVRQLLSESLWLSSIGGALGLLWAVWGIRALISFAPERTRLEMPYVNSVHADMTTLSFLFVIIVLTGVAFGIVGALQVSKSDCAHTLREESRTSAATRSGWLRDGLVVAELSVSIVLLTRAGLMVRSLSSLLHQNPGFDKTNLATFVVNLPESSHKDDPAIRQFAKRLSGALQQLAGVREVAIISKLPVTGVGNTIRFVIEGRAKAKGTEDEGSIRDVSTNYFSAMKIPILKGRAYEPQDVETSAPPRIVVNQAFADHYVPDEDPIGKRLRFTFSGKQPYQEIIGVVANESTEGLDVAMQPIMYCSFERAPDSAFYVVIRTPGDPQKMISSARLVLRGIDPEVPMIEPRSMDGVICDSYAVFLRRFPWRLITGFAVLAWILAVIGLYGQISFAVAQRTREIGVRVALGAVHRDVLRLIVGKGLLLMCAGVLLGIAAALALTRLLAGSLFGVSPNDPSTFVGVVVLLAVVSLAASLVAARRAAQIDPIVALRYE